MFKLKMKTLFTILVLMIMLPSMTAAAEGQNDNASSAEIEAGPPVSGKNASSFIPYYGVEYEQGEQVKDLYPNPGVGFDTPGFEQGKTDFTNTDEMVGYLNALDKNSEVLQKITAGYSLEGREIPLLIFTTSENIDSEDFEKKPTVWLEAQVHGNEPAAGESALVTAKKLAEDDLGENVLDDINVVMVPRKNPDGSYYFQREGALGLDINRDHMKMDYQETKILNQQYNRFSPEVALTSHEYMPKRDAFADIGEKGGVLYHDITLARGYNLNIPEPLRNMADNLFINNAHEYLAGNDYSSETYLTSSKADDGGVTVSETGTEPRFETNTQALVSSAMTFLIESRGIGIGRENLERRVHSQTLAHESFLKTTAENAKKVKNTVDEAREEIISKGEKVNQDDKIVVTSEPTKISEDRPLEIVDSAQGEVVEIPTTYYSNAEAKPTLERVRPAAYILPPAYRHIAEKLQTQGVQVGKLNEPKKLSVEKYTVTDQEIEDTLYEGYAMNHVETEIDEGEKYFPEGSYVFQMDQPSANMISMALEPEAVDSYVTFNFIPGTVDSELPIYRYMSEEPLDTEMVE